MNDFLTNIINNTKNENLTKMIKQWFVIEDELVEYCQQNHATQIISSNWENEVLKQT